MDQKFTTTSMYLAAFLAASGISMQRADVQMDGKYIFAFSDHEIASELAEQFLLGSGRNINARRYVEEIKHIKALMYDR